MYLLSDDGCFPRLLRAGKNSHRLHVLIADSHLKPSATSATAAASANCAKRALVHTAFYKFVRLDDASSVVAFLRELAHELAITGSVIVAEEGINGVAAGALDSIEQWERAIRLEALFNGAFNDIVFKRSQCITPPFGRMKVSIKKEIVAFGVDDATNLVSPNSPASQMLTPMQWRELIAQDDVVVLDNRNSFEYRLGRFRGAVNPQVANFREFATYVETHAPEWSAQGKRIAMYCTGGIRCEKSGGWMAKVGVPIYQLDGGILNYFQSISDAEKDWQGECFVFDNRVAIDTKLHETETTIEAVFEAEPDGQFRIARAKRLLDAVLQQGAAHATSRASARLSARAPRRPPTRAGVSASSVVVPQSIAPSTLVVDFLAQHFNNVSRETWCERIARGDVFDDTGRALRPHHDPNTHAIPNQRLFYFRDVENELRIPFEAQVLFQDEFLVVADKPHFLPVVPSGKYVQQTLLTRLKHQLAIDTLTPIHRIDLDTAGVVFFSIQPATRDAYQRIFRERRVEKIYEAIAPFRDDLMLPLTYRSRLEESRKFMQMHEVPGETNAETQIDIIEQRGTFARYALRPHTGQKHQLRAHMAALGIAIVNDRIYPRLEPFQDDTDYSKPLKLLAKSISFVDPMTGDTRQFDSALHIDF